MNGRNLRDNFRDVSLWLRIKAANSARTNYSVFCIRSEFILLTQVLQNLEMKGIESKAFASKTSFESFLEIERAEEFVESFL